MPVQQQMASFAKEYGGLVSRANAEYKDKPVDTGMRRLPGGIRNGTAKLSAFYTKYYEDDKQGLKGKPFWRISAVVVSPEEHNGEKITGLITSLMGPLCPTPAKVVDGKEVRAAKSFLENFGEFQNVFKLLGFPPCQETEATDPDGTKTEQYYMAAMRMLTDVNRAKTNPIYISFSTRGWTPPATPKNQKPEEMVFEEWHGLAKPPSNGQHDPAASVKEGPPPTNPATLNEVPPLRVTMPVAESPPPIQPTATAPHAPTTIVEQAFAPADPADVVAGLVEAAMNDPEGATDEGAAAAAELEKLAWANGWNEEQTKAAEDWAHVGNMALDKPRAAHSAVTVTVGPNGTPQAAAPMPTVTVGSKWMFAKRTKEGLKLRDNKGNEFPPQEVVVFQVDDAAGTCRVKLAKNGAPVVDIRTKEPVAVKFEWLEPIN